MRTIILALLMALTMQVDVAQAASFDCAKAATETEKAICSDPALSVLDDILGKYFSLKSSINLPEFLTPSDYLSAFPSFKKSETINLQKAWIENNQNKCYGSKVCLVSEYLDGVSNFLKASEQRNSYDADVKQEGWKIAELLELESKSTSVVVWAYNDGIKPERGCLGVKDFKTQYHLVTVHNSQNGKLLSYNPFIVTPQDNPCLRVGWSLSSKAQDSFSLSLNHMMSAGGWGGWSYNYEFLVDAPQVWLKSAVSSNYARNSGESTEIVINFDEKTRKVTNTNLNEEDPPTTITTEKIPDLGSLKFGNTNDNVFSQNFSSADASSYPGVVQKDERSKIPEVIEQSSTVSLVTQSSEASSRLTRYFRGLRVDFSKSNGACKIGNGSTSMELVAGYIKLVNLYSNLTGTDIPYDIPIGYNSNNDQKFSKVFLKFFNENEEVIKNIAPSFYKNLPNTKEIDTLVLGLLEYHKVYTEWRETQPDDFDRLSKNLSHNDSLWNKPRLLPENVKYPDCMEPLNPDELGGNFDFTFEDSNTSFWNPSFDKFAISFWYRREVDGTLPRVKEILDWVKTLN